LAQRPRSARGATRMTMRWPRASSASTKLSSSPCRALANRRRRRAGHPGLGVLVEHPKTPLRHRRWPTSRVRDIPLRWATDRRTPAVNA